MRVRESRACCAMRTVLPEMETETRRHFVGTPGSELLPAAAEVALQRSASGAQRLSWGRSVLVDATESPTRGEASERRVGAAFTSTLISGSTHNSWSATPEEDPHRVRVRFIGQSICAKEVNWATLRVAA